MSGESSFTELCEHEHTEMCQQCEALDRVRDKVVEIVHEYNWDNRDSVLFKVGVYDTVGSSTFYIDSDVDKWAYDIAHLRKQLSK